MDTLEAFKVMINTRGIYKALGLNENTVRYYRAQVNAGKEVSYSKMRELLLKAGWVDQGWVNTFM